MSAVLFAFTERGKATARRIRDVLGEGALYAPPKLAGGEFAPYAGGLLAFVGTVFDRDALIFVGATGIAVRAIAPHVVSKRSDPAVLCVDERGQYVIPLHTGHIGGANRLAWRIAEALGAVPVITTATDINGRFSVDAWATEHNMHIGSMALAKRVSAAILTREIPFYSDHCDTADVALPNGLIWSEHGALGVCVSIHDLRPFSETLLLSPRVLTVGIGCRRGISAEAVGAAIDTVFAENNLCLNAVAGAASIDIKSNEAGLLACCKAHGWPLTFYSAAQLSALTGKFTASTFVNSTVGVDNVCERAAAAGGGRVIVQKTALSGVTVAVAEMDWGISFEEDSRGGHRPGEL